MGDLDNVNFMGDSDNVNFIGDSGDVDNSWKAMFKRFLRICHVKWFEHRHKNKTVYNVEKTPDVGDVSTRKANREPKSAKGSDTPYTIHVGNKDLVHCGQITFKAVHDASIEAHLKEYTVENMYGVRLKLSDFPYKGSVRILPHIKATR
jgi:hypothetical protein